MLFGEENQCIANQLHPLLNLDAMQQHLTISAIALCIGSIVVTNGRRIPSFLLFQPWHSETCMGGVCSNENIVNFVFGSFKKML